MEDFSVNEVFSQDLLPFERKWNEWFFFNFLKFETNFLDFPEKTETNF